MLNHYLLNIALFVYCELFIIQSKKEGFVHTAAQIYKSLDHNASMIYDDDA